MFYDFIICPTLILLYFLMWVLKIFGKLYVAFWWVWTRRDHIERFKQNTNEIMDKYRTWCTRMFQIIEPWGTLEKGSVYFGHRVLFVFDIVSRWSWIFIEFFFISFTSWYKRFWIYTATQVAFRVVADVIICWTRLVLKRTRNSKNRKFSFLQEFWRRRVLYFIIVLNRLWQGNWNLLSLPSIIKLLNHIIYILTVFPKHKFI